MNYRRLGRSGLHVSEICLGAWINFGGRIEDDQTFAVLDAAIEEGIDFFDTADAYEAGKAEEVMGRWMQGKDRRTITIATKCFWRMWPGPNGQGAGRKHIMDACHDSLRRLQTDYIDVYQIHNRIGRRLRKRRYAHWMTWFGRARYGTSDGATMTRR
jgi:aryl-alcohol dehydrogenase-like predicted oxidoreductase